MIPTRVVLCGLAATLLIASGTPWAASWQWRDAQGRMVYSDRPPPPEVRPSQILRAPAAAASSATPASHATATSPAAPASAAAAASQAQSTTTPAAPSGAQATAAYGTPTAGTSTTATRTSSTWVERERAFRERLAEREAAETKAREESERAAHDRRACNALRENIRALESGVRVASLNARGEAEPIDDAERARRLKTARGDLERHCAKS